MDSVQVAGTDRPTRVNDGPIGFAGLSHLGIIYSSAAAAHGFRVVAYDERDQLTRGLQDGYFPVAEPGLSELYVKHKERLHYTSSSHALTQCSLVFLTLDVATDDANTSDLEPLQALIEGVAGSCRPGTVLALMSQVPPGFCRNLAVLLRDAGLRLFYVVETLVFGNAVERAMYPERYMVGCSDPAEALPRPLENYLKAFGCPILQMRYASAELCKIAINCFLVASVSTTNMLAEICENTGADWSEIAPALRLDRRIGPFAYLAPGLGIAGGNLERDLVTVGRLAGQNGTDARLIPAWQQNSAYRKDWPLRKLFNLGLLLKPSVRISIWGVAYKADTHSIKNSPSVQLIRSLAEYDVRTYDPAAQLDAPEFPHVTSCRSALECLDGADVLVIMTPWKEFSSYAVTDLLPYMNGHTILDPYGVLRKGTSPTAEIRYFGLGA